MKSFMKDIFIGAGLIFAAVLATFTIILIGNGLGFINYSFFAPKIVQVQTDTFKNSQAYVDGMANDLADLQIKYAQEADPIVKDSIRALIKQRYTSYDRTKLPPNLQVFLNSL